MANKQYIVIEGNEFDMTSVSYLAKSAKMYPTSEEGYVKFNSLKDDDDVLSCVIYELDISIPLMDELESYTK